MSDPRHRLRSAAENRPSAVALGAVVAAGLSLSISDRAAGQELPDRILYEQGDPTSEEQLLLELVNRARLDPVGEGDRIFTDYGSASVKANVDAFRALIPASWTRAENRDRWATYAPRPALAFNPALLRVSHQYSEAMRARDVAAQSFQDVPGLLTRVTGAGYEPTWMAQLLQGYTGDVLTTHASWAIDWGQPVLGGGRPETPNRIALVNPLDLDIHDYVEAGIGLIKRPDPPPGGVGPHVTTLTLGRSRNVAWQFVTGVVFDDRDRDGFYDIGEGVGGVRIDVEPSSHYALTSASGGYAVPVGASVGDVVVTASGVPGKASEVFRRQTTSGSTLAFGKPGNIKADFIVLPRPEPPGETSIAGDAGPATSGGEAVFDAVVPLIDEDHPTLGDIDVDVDIAHADRSRLRLELEAPDGNRVLLWEGGPGGADLVGTFDASLRSREALAALVDGPYAGTWRLRVADSAGEQPVVRSWALRVKPRWEGPLHARASHLVVTKLRLKDRNKPGKDQLQLRAEVDVGHPLPDDVAERAVLILREPEPPFVELARIPVAGPVGASGVLLTGDAKLDVRPSVKGTSRARLKLTVKSLQLPEDLPRTLRVELGLGDVLVSEDVKLTNGRFAGKRNPPQNGSLRVDSLRSRSHFLGLRTDLRARFLQPSLPRVPSVVEVRVGGASGLWLNGPIAVDGPLAVFGPSGDFSKLVLDTSTGQLRARAVGQHDPEDADGRVPISVWIGKHYEQLTVTPRRDGNGDVRY